MMNDDRDDDGDRGFPFFGGFSGFDKYFQDMSRHMEEMSRQMEDMFKEGGNINIGFHPPSMTGSSPPLNEDPRDQMLKGNDSADERKNFTQESSPNSQSEIRPFWSTNTPDNRLSVFSNSDSFVTGRMKSIQTIRHGDGSVERIEKTTENGRTCTTVTKTDPNGVSTTTTTCDRPAIDGAPSLTTPDKPSSSKPISPVTDPGAITVVPSVNTELTKEDAGFFSKLFGNFGFKPKS
ncbi:uncharacterized protein LOC123540612 [Mercenaria mercenaria]|uniref:uncharacterized protein LOC123540612 n=1 Tax=Mercenaria mercenaria TaxID=6596 RepID=UPI00234F39D0|nr:uncharacterized protein LOC123540612 [Mercenaria mercenaria]